MTDASLVYVTASTLEEAREIAKAAVEAKLAACANILGGIESSYWWNGELHRDQETALILKTKTSLVPQLTQKVREVHSYDCPCVVALPIGGGNPDFLQWISDETQ
ncbi:MAG: dihydroorotate dehydrogenase [Deltaproteobacteria bacterium RIFOXYA12_FULL_58_15]|nr:MAG: dihydroorotate dehydrogenase [Deltaproteobacteria bacterium RIFOXYA12_FULL_58_15]OGR11738.1 MAG: dihydroorotate dehydrogenase [Deltaproteobacteria bacterium RIFOXYB12_FULL_58_9]